MTRNIRVYLFLETILAVAGGFILPVYVLYFRYYQVSLFEIAILAAVFEASVLIFEIPTGLWADRFGRRLSVASGFIVLALSGAVFIIWQRFEGFLAAEILFGLGEALISGAGEALAVDSIPPDNKKELLPRMYIRRSRLRITALSLAMIISGYLFIEITTIAFWPLVIGGIAGFIACFLMTETDIKLTSPDGIRRKFLDPVKMMVTRLKGSAALILIFVLALVANFAFEGGDQYWQVLATELYNLDITKFGILTAAGAVLAFLLVSPVVKSFSGNLSLPLMLLLLAGVVISSLPNVPAMFLPYLLVVFFAVKQLISPVFSVAINSIIDAPGRATFLSGFNLSCSAGEVIAGIAAGIIAARFGVPVVFVVSGAVLVLFVFISLFTSTVLRSQPRN